MNQDYRRLSLMNDKLDLALKHREMKRAEVVRLLARQGVRISESRFSTWKSSGLIYAPQALAIAGVLGVPVQWLIDDRLPVVMPKDDPADDQVMEALREHGVAKVLTYVMQGIAREARGEGTEGPKPEPVVNVEPPHARGPGRPPRSA